MDPQIDKWVVEATTAHEVGVGQWAGLRVQELAEWEDLGPRTPPPTLHTCGPEASSGCSWGSHIQGSP